MYYGFKVTYIWRRKQIPVWAFYVYLNTPNEVMFLDNKMMTSGRFGFRFLFVITLQCSCLRVEGEGTQPAHRKHWIEKVINIKG